MALPNTTQLTSQLAKMPDQALKQMAMMHKNDPYTLPLIIAEDGRRKELRQAQQAAMYQPQPKVAEQDIAALGPLPEQVGIGQLPAPNVARMADGGIAGMPDESNEQLQYNNEPVLRMAQGGVAHYDGRNVGPYGQLTQADVQGAYDAWQAAQPSWYQQQTPTSGQRVADAEQRYKDMLNAYQTQPSNVQPGSGLSAITPPASVAPTQDMAAFDRATEDYMAQRANAKQGAGGAGAGTKDLTGVKKDTSGTTGLGGGVPSTKSLIDQFKSYVGAPEDKTSFLQERSDAMKDSYSKMESMIDKERSRISGDRQEALYMSMIKGGLAAAAGKSQYALQNLAEGFGQGASEFGDALKEFRKASREADKADAELARLKAGDKRADLDAYQRHKDSRDEKMASGVSALMSASTTAQAHVAAAGAGAKAAANAQRELMTDLGNAKPDSALVKGFTMLHPTDRPETAFAQMYARHIEESRKNMTEPMSPTQFATTMRAAVGAFKPKVVETPGAPSSAQIYSR